MATIVRITRKGEYKTNYFDLGNQKSISKMLGNFVKAGNTFSLGEHKYSIEEIQIESFYNDELPAEAEDGDYSLGTKIYIICKTNDPRAESFQDNLDTLLPDVSYYAN